MAINRKTLLIAHSGQMRTVIHENLLFHGHQLSVISLTINSYFNIYNGGELTINVKRLALNQRSL